ncbi:helix-turn-helix domain-containing protein [Saccharothrix australiensis]|uniref:PucR-like helix-turn-helix protein n=1 Tax=Saccharothrix australiensis TaxID=2072 RepID=A0A495W0W7_9PSEU|nr:GAF domain-containing protein [Saccharothrix australiensis]RKT53518.1 PucR-like helix-turn-helix protein [Saccharothrix australiensis]
MTEADAAEHLLELLDLLAADASSERLARVLPAARAAGVGGGDLDRLGRATERALRIRRTLTAHRRREAELEALFDTASDLAGVRDPDGVLRSIVRRARLLLGADTAYLSMNQPDERGTYMRVTDGSVSLEFQRLRLGLGEGLGGLVAQTAQPYVTADYAADDRFHHTPAIDSAVRDEGLVAILGVPLKLGRRVIGVLYAANRSPRRFPPDEVALLSSLADHAAIALDTAHLLEETRAAGETIRAHNEAMRRAEDAHDRLTDLVLRGADVPEVAAAVAEVLGGGIVVHDREGAELARTGGAQALAPRSAVTASRASGRAVPQDGAWVCAVLAGPELLGSIALTGRRDLADADRRLFERASVVTALLLLLRRTVAEAEHKVRGELITDLLTTPDPDAVALHARARRIGVDLAARHVVLVADGPRDRLLAAAAHHASTGRGLAGAHGEHVVLVLPGDDLAGAAAEAARVLGQAAGTPVTVGAGGPAAGPREVAAAHAEAVRCLRALLLLDRRGTGGTLADLGFVGVLLGDRADLGGYVRATLGPLLDYDASRGTELVRTVTAYFACGRHLGRTKDALHVHVNTVVQRLDRVAGLLGDDWQSPDRALEVHLALRLLKVLG